MLYLWVLDEFTFLPTTKQDKDEETTTPQSGIVITGLNNTIAQCIDPKLPSTIIGTNTINSKRNCFHHWRFKILSGRDPCDNYDFIIGIQQTDNQSVHSLIGSHGLKLNGTAS